MLSIYLQKLWRNTQGYKVAESTEEPSQSELQRNRAGLGDMRAQHLSPITTTRSERPRLKKLD